MSKRSININATCPRVCESSKTLKRLIKLISVFSWRHGVSRNIKFRKFPYHKLLKNIGTLSVQELFFQLIGWLGVELGVSPVGMVYFMG